jgi:hypothetical protein
MDEATPPFLSVSPDCARRGALVDLLVLASQFDSETDVRFEGAGLQIKRIEVLSPDRLALVVAVETGAVEGWRDMIIVRQGQSRRINRAFEVLSLPSSGGSRWPGIGSHLL